MKVSFYNDITTTVPNGNPKDVFKVLSDIKSGTYKHQISELRLENDPEKKKQLKKRLPNVTFGGVFSQRGNNTLKQHSGLACLDFDHVGNLINLAIDINSDKYTFASFISPSGNGLKVLVKIPLVDNDSDYKDYYLELIKYYSKYHTLDNGTKDIARATFLSYDSNLYINTEAETFTDKYLRPDTEFKENIIVNIPLTDQDEIANRLDKWFQKRWNSVNKNNNLHAYARQMNAFGVDQHICESYLMRYVESSKEREVKSLIKSAYKHKNDFGTKSFEDSEKVTRIKNLVLSGEGFDGIKSKITDIEPDKLSAEVDKHVKELRTDEFWYYTENNSIRLASFRFLTYLESNNIFKFYPDENSSAFLFVKKDDNFLSVFDENKIKDFTLADLRSRGIIDAFELMADNISAFSAKYLSMINTINVTFNRDKYDSSFIYYQNGVVKTTKDKIELLPYESIPDLIWKNQVIKRNITLKEESEGVFKTFIWKVSGQNPDRYYTLKSVIGYLMHSYQNDSKPKAIIFNDEMISEDIPNGGSGKGLIHKAMGHIKNIVTEDGKKFDPRSQFAYQKANKDTQIFLFDDVPKNFNFENLFSVVTEGMTIEKKGQDAFQIPFKESPKISITTNYTVKGSGASFYRRVFEVEIANYFNDSHTPEDEFKHQFFSDWGSDEWAKFDNFMIRCIQFYLKNGLVESQKVNLEFRKFRDEVGFEFIEFMEAHKFDGTPISRKEFRDKFNREYPNASKYNTAQKFNRKVHEYCKYYGWTCYEGKYNGEMMFYITPEKKSNDEYDDLPY